MTGIALALAGAVASGGVINTSFGAALSSVNYVSPGIRSASVTFNPDGTVSAVHGGSPANWYLPTIGGIGSGWSVRVTGTAAGTTITGMASGTWYSIATPQTVAYANSAANGEAIGTAAVAFSPDGGSTVISAGSITWDVGYAP
jgi:hypothetical protein